MKNLLLLFIFSFFVKSSFSQLGRLEVFPYIKFNKYSTFDDFFERSFSTKVNLKGTKFGIEAYYLKSITPKWEGRVGLGYFKYSFNSITNNDLRTNSTYPYRPIQVPYPDAILFYTNNYYYNTFTIYAGIDRVLYEKGNYRLTLGGGIQPYFSYSEQYNVTYETYADYKQKESYFFGFSGNLNSALTKSVGNFYFGPKIIIPVFDKWKKDDIFREKANEYRSNWFSGIGAGFTGGIKF